MKEENVDFVDMEQDSISAELQATIDKTAEELKAKDSKIRVIYPIVIDGREEHGEKPAYVAYFRQPDFPMFSKYLTASQKGHQAIAMRQLAKDCYLAGDRELIDDDSLFLFGLMGQFSKIIEMRNGRLANLSKPRK